MFTAVVYNSCTGSCKKYAELIAEQLGINAVEFGKAKGLGDGKVVYYEGSYSDYEAWKVANNDGKPLPRRRYRKLME